TESIPTSHTSRESAGSAPVPSIHTTPAAPPLLAPASPPTPLPAARRSPPAPHSAVPAKRPTCAVLRPCPTCLLLHRPGSAHTAPAAPTKTKTRNGFALLRRQFQFAQRFLRFQLRFAFLQRRFLDLQHGIALLFQIFLHAFQPPRN